MLGQILYRVDSVVTQLNKSFRFLINEFGFDDRDYILVPEEADIIYLDH